MYDGFLKVAAATPDLRVADVAYNVEQICRQIDEAAEQGARVIVFPELCITGYTCGDLFLQQTLLDAAEEGLIAVMRFTAGLKRTTANGLTDVDAIVFVGLPMEMDGKLYNVAAAVQAGKLLALIPKRNIPDHAEHHEGRYFTKGNLAPVPVEIAGQIVPFGIRTLIDATSSVEGLMIGCEICEDAWVAEAPHLALAKVGVTLMVNLSASAELLGKHAYRQLLIKSASAKMIGAYVYAASGPGESTAEYVFAGHRMICESGRILAESEPFTCGVTLSEIDVERLRLGRRRMTSYRASPDADDTYHRAIVSFAMEETKLTRTFEEDLFVPAGEEELHARCAQILKMQALGLKKRLEHTGAEKVVIGISGGLDSTLALIASCIAFDIANISREHVIGVTMPCFGTTTRTFDNACGLVRAMGASLREIDIREAVTTHLRDIGHDLSVHDVTYENAQARERTQVLMDLANMENGLVIGTGDLSELALGWCTYAGDQSSMYGINADVPKTLIPHIIRYYGGHYTDDHTRKILDDIVDTPVSPELLPPGKEGITQRTEDIVGPYELHDFFLYYMLRLSCTPEKILRLAKRHFAGVYEEETICKWLLVFYQRFFASQFKRVSIADAVTIGSVTLSPRSGFLMPSDAQGRLWVEDTKHLMRQGSVGR